MSKVNHHYVPQFHLRNFSSNGKSIGMFINNKKLFVKEASIKEQAYKKNLYGKTDDLENNLMMLEGLMAKITKDILASHELPLKSSAEYEMILLYLLMAEARVQKTAESQNNFVNKQMKLLAKMDKNIKISNEVIDKMKISYNVPNLLPMQVATKIYPILFDLRAILIISDSDRRFITTDNPLTRYNEMYVHMNYQLRGYGLGNMGIQLFYPISPEVCLCIYDDIMYHCNGLQNRTLRLVKGKDIDELNKLFYLNSMDYLFFSGGVSETYLNRIIKGLTPVHNLEKEFNVFGSEDEKLIAFQTSFVKEKIKLPFMKMNPELINMPLPAHMAGPLRPYANKFQESLK